MSCRKGQLAFLLCVYWVLCGSDYEINFYFILNVLRIVVVLLCDAVEFLLRDVFIAVDFCPFIVYVRPQNGNYIATLKTKEES